MGSEGPTNGKRKPDTEDLRRALADVQAASARMDDSQDEAAPADDARARGRLIDLIIDQVGPPPWVVILDGAVIAHTIDADGLAVFPSVEGGETMNRRGFFPAARKGI